MDLTPINTSNADWCVVSQHTNKKGKQQLSSVVVQSFRSCHNSGVAVFGTTVSVHKQKPVFTDHIGQFTLEQRRDRNTGQTEKLFITWLQQVTEPSQQVPSGKHYPDSLCTQQTWVWSQTTLLVLHVGLLVWTETCLRRWPVCPLSLQQTRGTPATGKPRGGGYTRAATSHTDDHMEVQGNDKVPLRLPLLTNCHRLKGALCSLAEEMLMIFNLKK